MASFVGRELRKRKLPSDKEADVINLSNKTKKHSNPVVLLDDISRQKSSDLIHVENDTGTSTNKASKSKPTFKIFDDQSSSSTSENESKVLKKKSRLCQKLSKDKSLLNNTVVVVNPDGSIQDVISRVQTYNNNEKKPGKGHKQILNDTGTLAVTCNKVNKSGVNSTISVSSRDSSASLSKSTEKNSVPNLSSGNSKDKNMVSNKTSADISVSKQSDSNQTNSVSKQTDSNQAVNSNNKNTSVANKMGPKKSLSSVLPLPVDVLNAVKTYGDHYNYKNNTLIFPVVHGSKSNDSDPLRSSCVPLKSSKSETSVGRIPLETRISEESKGMLSSIKPTKGTVLKAPVLLRAERKGITLHLYWTCNSSDAGGLFFYIMEAPDLEMSWTDIKEVGNNVHSVSLTYFLTDEKKDWYIGVASSDGVNRSQPACFYLGSLVHPTEISYKDILENCLKDETRVQLFTLDEHSKNILYRNVKVIPRSDKQIVSSPFYKIISKILTCSPIPLHTNRGPQNLKYRFTIGQTLSHVLLASRRGLFDRHRFRVIVRLSEIKYTDGSLEDKIPSCILYVNRRRVYVQTQCKAGGSIDITDKCDFNKYSSSHNELCFEWLPDHQMYGISIFIIDILDSEGIPPALMINHVRPANDTVEMIQNILKDDDEADIKYTSMKTQLTCPLSKSRLEIPCRGLYCTHLYCMDAKTLIKLNESRSLNEKKCYMCYKPLEYMYVDGLFLDILKSVPKTADEIEFQIDGSWSYTKPTENDSKKKSDDLNKVEEQNECPKRKQYKKDDFSDLNKTSPSETPLQKQKVQSKKSCDQSSNAIPQQDKSKNDTKNNDTIDLTGVADDDNDLTVAASNSNINDDDDDDKSKVFDGRKNPHIGTQHFNKHGRTVWVVKENPKPTIDVHKLLDLTTHNVGLQAECTNEPLSWKEINLKVRLEDEISKLLDKTKGIRKDSDRITDSKTHTKSDRQNISKGDNENTSKGKSINTPKGESVNISKGKQENTSKGKSVNISKGEQENTSKGTSVNISKGESVNTSKGERENIFKGESVNTSQGERLNSRNGEKNKIKKTTIAMSKISKPVFKGKVFGLKTNKTKRVPSILKRKIIKIRSVPSGRGDKIVNKINKANDGEISDDSSSDKTEETTNVKNSRPDRIFTAVTGNSLRSSPRVKSIKKINQKNNSTVTSKCLRKSPRFLRASPRLKNIPKTNELTKRSGETNELTKKTGEINEMSKKSCKPNEITKQSSKTNETTKNVGKISEIHRKTGKTNEMPKHSGQTNKITEQSGKTKEMTKNSAKTHAINKNSNNTNEITKCSSKSNETTKFTNHMSKINEKTGSSNKMNKNTLVEKVLLSGEERKTDSSQVDKQTDQTLDASESNNRFSAVENESNNKISKIERNPCQSRHGGEKDRDITSDKTVTDNNSVSAKVKVGMNKTLTEVTSSCKNINRYKKTCNSSSDETNLCDSSSSDKAIEVSIKQKEETGPDECKEMDQGVRSSPRIRKLAAMADCHKNKNTENKDKSGLNDQKGAMANCHKNKVMDKSDDCFSKNQVSVNALPNIMKNDYDTDGDDDGDDNVCDCIFHRDCGAKSSGSKCNDKETDGVTDNPQVMLSEHSDVVNKETDSATIEKDVSDVSEPVNESNENTLLSVTSDGIKIEIDVDEVPDALFNYKLESLTKEQVLQSSIDEQGESSHSKTYRDEPVLQPSGDNVDIADDLNHLPNVSSNSDVNIVENLYHTPKKLTSSVYSKYSCSPMASILPSASKSEPRTNKSSLKYNTCNKYKKSHHNSNNRSSLEPLIVDCTINDSCSKYKRRKLSLPSSSSYSNNSPSFQPLIIDCFQNDDVVLFTEISDENVNLQTEIKCETETNCDEIENEEMPVSDDCNISLSPKKEEVSPSKQFTDAVAVFTNAVRAYSVKRTNSASYSNQANEEVLRSIHEVSKSPKKEVASPTKSCDKSGSKSTNNNNVSPSHIAVSSSKQTERNISECSNVRVSVAPLTESVSAEQLTDKLASSSNDKSVNLDAVKETGSLCKHSDDRVTSTANDESVNLDTTKEAMSPSKQLTDRVTRSSTHTSVNLETKVEKVSPTKQSVSDTESESTVGDLQSSALSVSSQLFSQIVDNFIHQGNSTSMCSGKDNSRKKKLKSGKDTAHIEMPNELVKSKPGEDTEGDDTLDKLVKGMPVSSKKVSKKKGDKVYEEKEGHDEVMIDLTKESDNANYRNSYIEESNGTVLVSRSVETESTNKKVVIVKPKDDVTKKKVVIVKPIDDTIIKVKAKTQTLKGKSTEKSWLAPATKELMRLEELTTNTGKKSERNRFKPSDKFWTTPGQKLLSTKLQKVYTSSLWIPQSASVNVPAGEEIIPLLSSIDKDLTTSTKGKTSQPDPDIICQGSDTVDIKPVVSQEGKQLSYVSIVTSQSSDKNVPGLVNDVKGKRKHDSDDSVVKVVTRASSQADRSPKRARKSSEKYNQYLQDIKAAKRKLSAETSKQDKPPT